jgi:NADH-quinone oxidoreductase subunit K
LDIILDIIFKPLQILEIGSYFGIYIIETYLTWRYPRTEKVEVDTAQRAQKFLDETSEGLYYYSDYDSLSISELPIKFYLFFSFSLFFIGVLGIVFNRKSIINLMLCVELMLFGASLNFIFFSIFLSLPSGQIFALIIITIAAADSAVGLGILIAAFYLKRNISFEAFASLRG